MTQDTKFQPQGLFPRKHVVSVIDSLPNAEKAVQALREAGYDEKGIYLIHGQDFVEGLKETQQSASGLAKLIHGFQATTDEGFAGDMYLKEAEQGHEVLAVYAPKAEEANRIRDVIIRYNAHLIKYFGEWAVEDLPA
jgi:hypothetical protein